MSHFAAQKQFWEAPGDHFGLPGRSIFGTWARCNTTAGSPILGRKKKLLGGSRGSFWASRGCIFGTWARCIKTWHYLGFLGVHHQRHPCSLSPKIQKIDVSEQGGFNKIIPGRHFWHQKGLYQNHGISTSLNRLIMIN